jgi:YobI-like P-loop NTPase
MTGWRSNIASIWKKSPVSKSTGYVDLAPTDKADRDGIYSAALTNATNNPNVYNIALTGPYGSGKSSIIKTFLKNYKKYGIFKKPVLQISLAAFLPEAEASGGNVSKQEIERSILQQMLYGADANNLPLSRFKRIQAPRWWAAVVSLFVVVGLAACWHLIQSRLSILDGSFFQPIDQSNWFNLSSFSLGLLFVWYLAHQIYIKSLGVSIKSISLKDVELTPETDKEESILNRHLDEIIYFFQCTKYDLVVVEDLDRFNNPDIFVTLREINSLVNANAGIKRQVRFLYALRDNMFKNTDRTKFFEFIIPVIPIINSSNSIDKVIEQGRRLSLSGGLELQFLREVSRFLNDLRLIQNIFNEYAIYVQNLETDDENVLNPNKLLAVLIYKNVLPSDFEELHRERGKLANILNQHNALIVRAEAHYKEQIAELEAQIAAAEKQMPGNLEELRKIYAMSLFGKLPQNPIFVQIGGKSRIPIQSLWSHPDFDEIIEANQISCISHGGHSQLVNTSTLQAEVDDQKPYRERKQEIERKTLEFKNETTKTISELRSKRSALRMTKFNKILQVDASNTDALFDAFGESRDLVRYLVMEGFLDDTYYQYTSLFHSGRLSPNDNKFLIQIRAFNTPEPEFQIDNPKEIIAAMRDDDFRQSFVLNVILVDSLLGNAQEFPSQIAKLNEYVSKNFGGCEKFFSAYYEAGKYIPALLSGILKGWHGFVSETLQSQAAASHVANLIAYLPDEDLRGLQQVDDEFSEFVSSNLSDVLAVGADIEPDRLKLLAFEVQDLVSVQQHPAIVQALANEGMYKLSRENVEYVYNGVLGLPHAENLPTKHYTTILESNNSTLIDKVEGNFEIYLEEVLLSIDTNIDESVAAILKVLNRDEIEIEQLESFLERQSAIVPHLSDVPTRLHGPIFDLEKIEVSWANCLAYISSETFDAAILTNFLARDHIQAELSCISVNDDESALPLRQFLVENNEMAEATYRAYIRTLPKRFKKFPENLDPEKWRILVEEEKVSFSSEAFALLSGHPEYQTLFIANNFDEYSNNRDRFEIDDDFRERLLASHISDEQRLTIVEDMDLSAVTSLASRATIIGELFYRTDADVSGLSEDVAEALITNTTPINVQVSLLNRCQNVLSDIRVKQILAKMPRPFPEIQPGWRQPTIPKTAANVELASWLDARGIISSWKETYLGEIRIYNFRS